MTTSMKPISTYSELNRTWNSHEGRYDKSLIRALNILTNTLLLAIDLTDYPNAKARLNSGTVTIEEFSKFLFDEGIDPVSVKALFLRDFPVPININMLESLNSNGAKSGVLMPGASDLISSSRELVNIINTAGGLVNIQNMTDRQAESYLNRDIKDASGTKVGTINETTGQIRNINDELIGTVTESNDIESADKEIIVSAAGEVISTRTGERVSNSPTLAGYNATVSGQTSTSSGTDPLVSNVSLPTPENRFVPGLGEDTSNWNPSEDMKNYLSKLDFHYEVTFGAALESRLCTQFSDPFKEVSALMALSHEELGFDLYKQIVEETANEPIIVDSGSGFERYDSLIKDTMDLIDELKEKYRLKIESITDTIQNFLNETNIQGAHRPIQFFGKKKRQLDYLFSDINIQYIKRKLANVANSNRLQFENLEVFTAVLNVLLLKLCNISAHIEFTFEKEIEEYKTLTTRYMDTFYAQETKSLLVSSEAISHGAIRVNPRDRIVESTEHSITHNQNAEEERLVDEDEAVQIFPTKHVNIPMTEEEKTLILNLTEEGNEYFLFHEAVKEMGYIAREMYLRGGDGIVDHEKQWHPDQNYYEAGWKMIQEKTPSIYASLIRISKRLGSGPLTLNSCYRSLYYNRVYLRQFLGLNAGWNSPHCSAQAVDISTNGLSNLDTARLIQYASQEGFNRISVYDTFIHADIQDGAYRGDWTKNYRGDPNIRQAMALHLTRQHTEGRKA